MCSICSRSWELPLKSEIEKTNFRKKKKRFWKNENWKNKHILTHLSTQDRKTINGCYSVYLYIFINYYKIKKYIYIDNTDGGQSLKMRRSYKKRWHIQMPIFAHFVINSYKIVHLNLKIVKLLTRIIWGFLNLKIS